VLEVLVLLLLVALVLSLELGHYQLLLSWQPLLGQQEQL
jgi:hypothetical protein